MATSERYAPAPKPARIDLIDQTIAFVRYQFASTRYLACRANLRMVSQPRSRSAEKPIHVNSRIGVFSRDVVPNVGSILFRLRRPDDDHA